MGEATYLDRLQKVSLLLFSRVFQQFLNVSSHSGDRDFGHGGRSSRRNTLRGLLMVRICDSVVVEGKEMEISAKFGL